MTARNPLSLRRAAAALPLALLVAPARADTPPEWVATLPVGASLSAGIAGLAVDAAGVSYVTGITGSSSNTDVVTAAFAPDGSLLWEQVFDGPAAWHDQARGICLGPGGVVWVTGNTPGAGSFADVLLLRYDAATGAQLGFVQYTSGPFTSEHGASAVTDAQGNLYVGGGTVGDGGDVLLLKFDASGQLLWSRTWDGPASAPFSQDVVREVQLDPGGNLVVLIHGVMSSLQPDYVVLELAAADGATVWETSWGVSGGDYPADMALDAAGDVYVTGTGIDLTDKLSTVKLRGSDGQLLWQAYDSSGIDDRGVAVAVDGAGGVYVAGAVDHDGNQSNFNDNVYAVKRDAATGALLWTFEYGQTCVGCLDVPSDVAVDPAGNVFVGSTSSSAPYGGDGVTFVLAAADGAETARLVAAGIGSGFLRFDAEYDLYNGGGTYDPNTGQVEIAVVEFAALAGGPVPYCTPKASSGGCLTSVGTSAPALQPVSGAGDYAVTATDVRGLSAGLVLAGIGGPAALPFAGGTLCVNPPTKRGPIASSGGTSTATCDGAFATTVNDGVLLPFGLDAGTGNSAWYQYWYRDPLNGPGVLGSALSDAVRLDFE